MLDWRVISAALLLSSIVGLTIGFVPAFRFGRAEPYRDLQVRDANRVIGGRMRSALLVAQIAATLALLSGAGALSRDFISLMRRDLGFEADRSVHAWLPLTTSHADATDAAERIANISGIHGCATRHSF